MTCNGNAQRDTTAASAQWSDAGYRWAACGGREEQPRACCGSRAVILSHGGMRQLLASICSIVQQLAFALYAWHAHAAWRMKLILSCSMDIGFHLSGPLGLSLARSRTVRFFPAVPPNYWLCQYAVTRKHMDMQILSSLDCVLLTCSSIRMGIKVQ